MGDAVAAAAAVNVQMALLLLIIHYAVFVILRKLFSCLQGLCWLLSGTYFTRRQHRLGDDYHNSAQLLSVLYQCKFDLIAQPSGSDNFLTTHEKFVSPNYVLQDNVTLYSVTDTEAVFVETDPDVDVTSSDCDCFMRVAQFKHAKRIIILPISSLHRLAEEIGDPPGQLIFLTSTARCGSTLFCQIFEETGKCMSYSEPDYFHVINAYRNKLSQEEMERILRNSTRLLCKPVKGKTIKAYLIKPIAHFVTAVPLFLRVFPESKQLFMYRDGIKVARSMLKMFDQVPISQVTAFVAKYLPWIFKVFCIYSVHFPAIDIPEDMNEKVEFGIFIWALTCRCYNQLRANHVPIQALKYEHLIKQPLSAIRAILKYCDLPEEWARPGHRAMGKDSQRGSLISLQKLGIKENIVLTGKNRVVADGICDNMRLPRIDKPCILDGTITDL